MCIRDRHRCDQSCRPCYRARPRCRRKRRQHHLQRPPTSHDPIFTINHSSVFSL